jgi:hypothetical protein
LILPNSMPYPLPFSLFNKNITIVCRIFIALKFFFFVQLHFHMKGKWKYDHIRIIIGFVFFEFHRDLYC